MSLSVQKINAVNTQQSFGNQANTVAAETKGPMSKGTKVAIAATLTALAAAGVYIATKGTKGRRGRKNIAEQVNKVANTMNEAEALQSAEKVTGTTVIDNIAT